MVILISYDKKHIAQTQIGRSMRANLNYPQLIVNGPEITTLRIWQASP